MEITFNISALDNHFVVTVGPIKLNANEQAQRTSLGPFLVDFGGTFDNSDDIDFTLPTKQVRVPDEIPQTVKFSIETLTAAVAAAHATYYQTIIQARIQAALNTWMAFDPIPFEGNTVVTITAT
jgi:hypothetical protein